MVNAGKCCWPWLQWHPDIKGFPGMCLPWKKTQYGGLHGQKHASRACALVGGAPKPDQACLMTPAVTGTGMAVMLASNAFQQGVCHTEWPGVHAGIAMHCAWYGSSAHGHTLEHRQGRHCCAGGKVLNSLHCLHEASSCHCWPAGWGASCAGA